MRKSLKLAPVLLALIALAFQFFGAEKFTNPETGSRHRVGLSPAQELSLGVQSYRQVLAESETVRDGPEWDAVQRVAARLVRGVKSDAEDFAWQVSLVRSSQINAFCLPGGKMVVYTGILPVAQTDAGLATVLGHEIAHATSRHGSQRVFQETTLRTALVGAQFAFSDMDEVKKRTVLGLLGAGAQFGVLLPFGRAHEIEADQIGIRYMARAGYDPRESLAFWQRMERRSGRQPPEFLSTHPSHGTRIERLKEMMPAALEEYERAADKDPATAPAFGR
jgi:predicted Zn-dependent protease